MARPTEVELRHQVAHYKHTSRRWAATSAVLTVLWCGAAVTMCQWDGHGALNLSVEEIILAADSDVNEEAAVQRLGAIAVLCIRKLREKESDEGRGGMIARLQGQHIHNELHRPK